MYNKKTMMSHKCTQKYVFLSMITVMLLAGCGDIPSGTAGEVKDTEIADADRVDKVSETTEKENTGADEAEGEETKPQVTGFEVLDYPFPYGMEGWRLVLCTESAGEETDAHTFRMYDAEGDLIQAFACDMDAEHFVFRFDNLCDDYQLNDDLEVFPEDQAKSGGEGFLFTWDGEEDRFVEEPIVIPWYEEARSGSPYSTAPFLVKEETDNGVTNVIYYINDKTRRPVKLRTWTLSNSGSKDDAAELYLYDHLYETVLYDGEVQWAIAGRLKNDEYYQELFWKDLPHLWDYTADSAIYTTKYIGGEGGVPEDLEYDSRESLLDDCGFSDAEPFYRYYDRFGNPELEVFFDEDTGKGCGFSYSYSFNYELEEIVDCFGFIFEGVYEREWEDDTYSLLTWEGADAREYVDIPNTLTSYNEDGQLLEFAVSGYMETEWDDGPEFRENEVLSMDWVYRDDGTLYRKYYYHDPRCFSTTCQSQRVYYDESGRPAYRYEYITHGSFDYYYIYDGQEEEPKYCLCIDWNLSSPVTEMIVYR